MQFIAQLTMHAFAFPIFHAVAMEIFQTSFHLPSLQGSICPDKTAEIFSIPHGTTAQSVKPFLSRKSLNEFPRIEGGKSSHEDAQGKEQILEPSHCTPSD